MLFAWRDIIRKKRTRKPNPSATATSLKLRLNSLKERGVIAISEPPARTTLCSREPRENPGG
jgi:hypothetical protein